MEKMDADWHAAKSLLLACLAVALFAPASFAAGVVPSCYCGGSGASCVGYSSQASCTAAGCTAICYDGGDHAWVCGDPSEPAGGFVACQGSASDACSGVTPQSACETLGCDWVCACSGVAQECNTNPLYHCCTGLSCNTGTDRCGILPPPPACAPNVGDFCNPPNCCTGLVCAVDAVGDERCALPAGAPADLVASITPWPIADQQMGIPFTVNLVTSNIAPAGAATTGPSFTTITFDSSTSSILVGPLAPGTSAPVQAVSLTCTSAGPKTLLATADATGTNVESDEGNTISSTFNCIAPPAPSVCTGSLESMQTYSFLAMLGAILFVALSYMVGEAIGSPRITSWAKGEVWQVVASIVIVIGCIAAVNMFCIITPPEILSMTPAAFSASPPDLSKSFGSAAAGNMYDASMQYLGNAAGYVRGVAVAARYNMGVYELRSSLSKFRCDSLCLLTSVGHSKSPYSGETAYISVFSAVLNVATLSLLALIFQIFTLQYIATGVFAVMLPLAIVMRSIPFLRAFGGSLVAIFLSLYIFYPIMIVFGGMVLPAISWELGAPLPNRMVGHPAISDVLGPVSTPSHTEENTLNTYFSVDERERDDMSALIKLGGIAFFAGIFMPALGFIIIAAVARETARLIGEEVDIGRLGQMI